MAIPRSKQRNLKRLNDQIKKHSNNPKMIEKLKSRIKILESQKG